MVRKGEMYLVFTCATVSQLSLTASSVSACCVLLLLAMGQPFPTVSAQASNILSVLFCYFPSLLTAPEMVVSESLYIHMNTHNVS